MQSGVLQVRFCRCCVCQLVRRRRGVARRFGAPDPGGRSMLRSLGARRGGAGRGGAVVLKKQCLPVLDPVQHGSNVVRPSRCAPAPRSSEAPAMLMWSSWPGWPQSKGRTVRLWRGRKVQSPSPSQKGTVSRLQRNGCKCRAAARAQLCRQSSGLSAADSAWAAVRVSAMCNSDVVYDLHRRRREPSCNRPAGTWRSASARV